MKSVYELKEHSEAELKVTVDGEKWEEACKKAKRKAVSGLQIPGFRKGHVPANLVNKYVNEEAVKYNAAEDVAQAALEFGLTENNVILVDRPNLTNVDLKEDSVELTFTLTVYPEVKVGDYKSVKYSVNEVSVTEDEVNAEIVKLQQKNAEEVLKEEGTVAEGDIAVIDFEGFVDGVAFEGGKGTEYPLEIGSNTFIPGFEEQLIGLATGEEKDVNVTFPEQYEPSLAGKAAVFKCKVCGIKEKKLPEVDEAFVEDLGYENVKTVEELKAYLNSNLLGTKQSQAQSQADDEFLKGLTTACEVEIPEAMIASETQQLLDQYKNRLASQGIDMHMYYQITGSSEEMFTEQIKPEAERNVRTRICLSAIGDDLAITVSDEDLEAEFKKMSEEYGMEVAQIKAVVPTDALAEDVKIRKTIETLKTAE